MEEGNDFFYDLIVAVREEEMLYSKNNPLYMDRTAKKKAWERISNKLGKGAKECEKRWWLLREKYGRESRKLEEGSAATQEKPWPYLEAMEFLKEHVKRRRTRDTTLQTTCEPITYLEIVNAAMDSTQHCSEIEHMSPSSVSNFCKEPPSKSKKRKREHQALIESDSDREIADTFKDVFGAYAGSNLCKKAPSKSKKPKKEKQALIESDSDREIADTFKEVFGAYAHTFIRKLEGTETEDELFMKTILKMMEPLPIQSRDNIKRQIMDFVLLERSKHNTQGEMKC